MINIRSYASVAVLNERLYVCGGYNMRSLSSVEVYDAKMNRWWSTVPMNLRRSEAGIAVIDNFIYGH